MRTVPRLSMTLAAMLLARITLNIVVRITYPFLPAIARGLGVDLTSASLLVTARAAGGLTSPLFGAASDRVGRKRLMLFGLALLVAGAAMCAVLPFYAAFMAAFVLFGLAKAMYDPSMHATLGDRVPYAQRGRAIGIIELSWAGAWLVGVPAAGWLIARAGWQAPYAFVALLGAAGLALIAWILPPDPPAHLHADQRPSTRAQLAALARNRNLVAMLCVTGLISIANELTFVVYGAWMEDRFGLSVAALGVASIVIGLAEAAGELGTTALTDRLGKRRAVLIGLGLLAVAYGVLPSLGQRLEWALGGLALLFVAFEFTIVSGLPLMSELAPHARATAMAANLAAATTARMMGAVAGTALFTWTGKLEPNATASVVATAVAFAVLWRFVRERPPTTDDGPPLGNA